jgi:hypothetical protein
MWLMVDGEECDEVRANGERTQNLDQNLGSIVSVGLDEMLTEIESRSGLKSELNHE